MKYPSIAITSVYTNTNIITQDQVFPFRRSNNLTFSYVSYICTPNPLRSVVNSNDTTVFASVGCELRYFKWLASQGLLHILSLLSWDSAWDDFTLFLFPQNTKNFSSVLVFLVRGYHSLWRNGSSSQAEKTNKCIHDTLLIKRKPCNFNTDHVLLK